MRSEPWEVFARGARAAEDILASVYGIEVRKALNPLNLHDFESIVRSLSTSLKGQVVPVQDGALKLALSKLDAKWTDLDADARAKLIGEAATYLGPPVVAKVLPAVDQTLAFAAKDIVSSTKKSAVLTYDLSIKPDFNATDDRIANYVRVSEGHFIRDRFGNRMDSFAQQAREIVASGLERGSGSADIGDRLNTELGGEAGRGLGYWNMIAMVFANRARTMTQLASFHEAGIESYIWESVLDEATSVQCRFMHGRVFPVARAMGGFQQIEDQGYFPESIKRLQPFVSLGRDGDRQALVFGRGDKRRVAGHVLESGLGQKDHVGSYENALGDEALAAAGVYAPPIHGSCRSTIIPQFGAPGGHAPPAPSAGPPKLTSGQKKAAALAFLQDNSLKDKGYFTDELGMMQPSTSSIVGGSTSPFLSHEVFNDADSLASAWSANSEPKKPSIEKLIPTNATFDASLVAKFIQNAKALAAAPTPKIVQHEGLQYILDGHEKIVAQKLLGQKTAHVDALNLDKKLKVPEAAIAPYDMLNDPTVAIVWDKSAQYEGKILNGIPIAPAKAGYWENVADKNVGEKPLPKPKAGAKKISAGCVVVEPDGRIWLVEPKDHFGGYEHTFPKGGVEKGLTTQQNAMKEVYEEAGLSVDIVGTLGDYEGDTSITRYFIAHRTGGAPWTADWESQKVKLVPLSYDHTPSPSNAATLLNKARDKKVLADFIKLQGQPKAIPAPPPRAGQMGLAFPSPAMVAPAPAPPPGVILGTKLTGRQGSNPGGLYRGTDGVERYVKFYDDPLQAHTEQLVNKIYRDLGLGAPKSCTFDHEGKLAYASEIIADAKKLSEISELTPALAQKAMQGFAADILSANWDAAGLSLDNMVLTRGGEVARIDNGGCLLLRAQGTRKPEGLLNKIGEWESFFSDKNRSYQRIAKAAGFSNAEQMRDMLIPQIEKIATVREAHGGWAGYVEQTVGGMAAKDKARVVEMLEARTTLLRGKLEELKLLPPTTKKVLPKGEAFTAPSGRRTPIPMRDHEVLEVRELAGAPDRNLPYELNTPPGGEPDYVYREKVAQKIKVITPETKEEVNNFTDGTYGPIRGAQSMTKKEYDVAARDSDNRWKISYTEAKKQGAHIEAAFGKVQSQPGQIFRALKRVSKETIDALMSTDEINLLGTSSCSRKARVSIDDFMGGTYGSDYRVLFVIHQRSAIGVETISNVPQELELLLSKRARFKVLARHKATENAHCLIVELDEIDGLVPIVKWFAAVRRAFVMRKNVKDHGLPFILPPGWPTHGELAGKQVDLVEAVRTMHPLMLACVVVDVPGVGRYQPWKGSEHVVGADGKVYI